MPRSSPSSMGAAFLLQYLSAELRCKCFSGGKVRKAPSNEIVLIVAATRAALVFDPALMVKLVHVVHAATEPTGRNLYFDDIVMTHHLPKASSAFVADHCLPMGRLLVFGSVPPVILTGGLPVLLPDAIIEDDCAVAGHWSLSEALVL